MNSQIITNSGMLRPLDEAFLSNVQVKNSVISLMYEGWELREADLSIKYCEKMGIRVCGVNEHDRYFPIFDFVGPLLCKMMFEAGYEIFENNIVIWSRDRFGEIAVKYLKAMGAREAILVESAKNVLRQLPTADVLIIADYKNENSIFKEDRMYNMHSLSIDEVKKISPSIGIIHLFGDLDYQLCELKDLKVYPPFDGCAHKMSLTFAHLGSNPVIRLATAGLQAGQEVLTASKSRFSQPLRNVSVWDG